MNRTLLLFGLALSTLVAACGPADNEPTTAGGSTESPQIQSVPPGGPLVIVGGALQGDNEDVYHAVLERREGDGPFCVIPTASGAPAESMASSMERFSQYSGDAKYEGQHPTVVGVWITVDNAEAANDPAVVDQIAACSGYWFVGGQQSRIVRTFRPETGDTPAYDALMQRWREGAVVAGSSAGAAMMSSRSIGGGSPAEALEFGVTTEQGTDGIWVMPGLDFVPWAIVGQHHLARGRWGRLVVATLESPDVLGLGIDENTALVYEEGVAEVVGASGVLMIDASAASQGPEPRTATGIRLEFLGNGDRVDVRTLDVTRELGQKTDEIPERAATVSDTDDAPPTPEEVASAPFERWAFLHLLHAFASGDVTEATLDGGARSLTLTRAAGFTALASTGSETVDGPGTPAGLSVGPLVLGLAR